MKSKFNFLTDVSNVKFHEESNATNRKIQTGNRTIYTNKNYQMQ